MCTRSFNADGDYIASSDAAEIANTEDFFKGMGQVRGRARAKGQDARRYESDSWLRKARKGWRHISCIDVLAEPANSAFWRVEA